MSDATEAVAGQKFDERLWVGNYSASGVKFRVPTILIEISLDDDGNWIASDHFSTVYGEGASPEQASDDYIAYRY